MEIPTCLTKKWSLVTLRDIKKGEEITITLYILWYYRTEQDKINRKRSKPKIL